MRVEPELTTHLKFRRLKAAVGDSAMECLITIWAHCQQNQRGEFWPGADAAYVEELCNWTGQKGELFRALVECGRPKLGFIVPEADGITVHDWDESNSQMVQNWYRNRAGRTKKTPKPWGSQGDASAKPTGNPTLSGGLSQAAAGGPHLPLGQMSDCLPESERFTGSNDNPPGSQWEANASPVGSHGDPSAQSFQSFSPISPPPLSALYAVAKRLIATLNTLTGSSFNPPLAELDQIVNRLHEVQYDFAGVEKMLRHRCAVWLNDAKSRTWLKPGTLFGPNFHDYYGQRDQPTVVPQQNKTRGSATDRTELLETLSTARAQLKQNPGDAALAKTVRELEAAAG